MEELRVEPVPDNVLGAHEWNDEALRAAPKVRIVNVVCKCQFSAVPIDPLALIRALPGSFYLPGRFPAPVMYIGNVCFRLFTGGTLGKLRALSLLPPLR